MPLGMEVGRGPVDIVLDGDLQLVSSTELIYLHNNRTSSSSFNPSKTGSCGWAQGIYCNKWTFMTSCSAFHGQGRAVSA